MNPMMILRWSAAKPGHEVDAMRLADDATAYFTELAKGGRTSPPEWVSNITGTDGGMFIVRGDLQALSEVSMSPEFAGFNLRGIRYLDNWHWDWAFGGSTVDEVYPGWRQFVGA